MMRTGFETFSEPACQRFFSVALLKCVADD